MLAGEVAFAKYLCSVWDKQLCQLKAVFYHPGSDGIAVFEVVGAHHRVYITGGM